MPIQPIVWAKPGLSLLAMLLALGAVACAHRSVQSPPQPVVRAPDDMLAPAEWSDEQLAQAVAAEYLPVVALGPSACHNERLRASAQPSEHGTDVAVLVIGGAAELRAGSRVLPMRKGSVAWVPAGTRYQVTGEGAQLLVVSRASLGAVPQSDGVAVANR